MESSDCAGRGPAVRIRARLAGRGRYRSDRVPGTVPDRRAVRAAPGAGRGGCDPRLPLLAGRARPRPLCSRGVAAPQRWRLSYESAPGRRPIRVPGNPLMRRVLINGHTHALPFADLLRPLSDREWTELRASIETQGVLCPLVTYESPTHG